MSSADFGDERQAEQHVQEPAAPIADRAERGALQPAVVEQDGDDDARRRYASGSWFQSGVPGQARRAPAKRQPDQRAAARRAATAVRGDTRPDGIGRNGRAFASSCEVEEVVPHHPGRGTGSRTPARAAAANQTTRPVDGSTRRRSRAEADVGERGEHVRQPQELGEGEQAVAVHASGICDGARHATSVVRRAGSRPVAEVHQFVLGVDVRTSRTASASSRPCGLERCRSRRRRGRPGSR